MSKIAKLNRIFRGELGDEPRFEWIHSRSKKLWVPVELVDPDTLKPVLDQHCICGIDKRVHKPECKLSVMLPRHEMKPLIEVMPQLKGLLQRDVYIVCKNRVVTEKEWKDTFHSLAYPGDLWAPVSSNGLTLALPDPNEDDTYAAISLIKEHRNTSWRDLKDRIEGDQRKLEVEKRNLRRDALRELRPVRPFPGKTDGNVSLPSVAGR